MISARLRCRSQAAMFWLFTKDSKIDAELIASLSSIWPAKAGPCPRCAIRSMLQLSLGRRMRRRSTQQGTLIMST
jgi:hypothetical protein